MTQQGGQALENRGVIVDQQYAVRHIHAHLGVVWRHKLHRQNNKENRKRAVELYFWFEPFS
jgi:hypothetical protein